MSNTFHILNGDALKMQWPPQVHGDVLVLRECFIDGPVSGETKEELYRTRAKFLSENYDSSTEDYYTKCVTEFEDIQSIPKDSTICLWFEDDLFCQVNLWFALDLLKRKEARFFLVRPKVHTPQGFGGLDGRQLIELYENRIPIDEFELFSSFWALYQRSAIDGLLELAVKLQPQYSFLLPAVQALADSLSTDGQPGRPLLALIEIKKDLNTEEFGPIFKEFSQREPIYGFGDLQVRRLLQLLE